MAFNLSQIQALLRQAGWPENQIAKAAAIVMYESSGNPNAHNPAGEDSWGLLQINWPYHRGTVRSRLVEPLYNLTYALTLWRARPNYRDWYNSNKKYEGTYPGTAAQKATWLRIRNESWAIYNGGGNVQPIVQQTQVITNPQTIYAAANNLPEQPPQTSGYGKEIFIIAGVGLAALLVFGTVFTSEPEYY